MVFKSIQIGLHAVFLNEKILTLCNVFFRVVTFNILYLFCDRSNLFAVLEWSVNCLSETCYFNLKYLLRKLSNETVLQNSNDFIGCS